MMESTPIDSDTITEKNRGREETRIAEVYDDLNDIDVKWAGVRSIIRVCRKVKRGNNETEEIAYFISSLPPTNTAKTFNLGIRSHWAIENSLHYTKDKTFKEDESKIRTGNAPENFSVFRNIVLNIFRHHGWTNMAQAMRLAPNDVGELWNLIIA